MIVETYEPTVYCDPRPPKIPLPELCEKAVNSMPSRRRTDVFLQDHDRPRPRPKHSVTIPKAFSYRECYLFSSVPKYRGVYYLLNPTSVSIKGGWFELRGGLEVILFTIVLIHPSAPLILLP